MADTSKWQIDPTHSSVEFSVKHMMITTVRGRFKDVKGTIEIHEDALELCCAEVEMKTASIDTGVEDRDVHLRSADFFDAEAYPTIRFESKRIEGEVEEEGDRFRMIGDLTIRDTTMEVALDVLFEGRGMDPWGNERIGFGLTGEIDRRDWGLKWNQAIETGGVLVANKVKLEAEVQIVRQMVEEEAEA